MLFQKYFPTTIWHRLRTVPLREWPTLPLSTAEGSLIFMAAFLISATLGVVRQILFNVHFGVGEEAAALYAAFRLSETISILIAGGALTNALVPHLLLAARAHQRAISLLVSRVLTLMLIIAIPVTFVLWLAAPPLLRWFVAPGLDPQTQGLASLLTRIMLAELVLLVAEGVLSAVLIAHGQFFLPAAGIALRNTMIILTLLLPEPTIITVAIGSLGDSVIQLLILIPGLWHHRLHVRPAWQISDPLVRGTLRLAIPGAISGAINYSNAIVDTAIASLGGQAAGLGAMHNALLLGNLPQRLCGTAIGQAAFPYLAAAAVSRDRKLFQQRWLTTITTAAFLATMSALALIGWGRWLIRLIFEHGAFDSAAGDLTFAILQLFALGLPIYVIVEITGRALVALGDARTPLIANGAQLLTRIGVATLLWPMVGVLAVPIATVASGIVEVSILCGILWKRLSMVTDWHTIGDTTVSL